MPLRIEDYALIGDNQTAALVGIDGSIDWLCLPRFDSGACFAALLGDASHGRWLIAPRAPVRRVRRRYRQDSLVLETELTTDDGTVRLVDCMTRQDGVPDVLRLVQGVDGRVDMQMELVIRFDYGSIVPWVRRSADGALTGVAGPDAVCLRTPAETHGEDLKTVADFAVGAGDCIPFALAWYPSIEAPPAPLDAVRAVEETDRWWRDWTARATYDGRWSEAVRRSLITLKALQYEPTGGIVAAPTTSLPEQLGDSRNWDYRFCWIRDATFTLYALMLAGYHEESRAWRDWLLRAVAGHPAALQILYGPGGERRLPELTVDWLPGYADSRPVRVGNAASRQFQLDVYGELMDTMHVCRRIGVPPSPDAWRLECALLDFLESAWSKPDEGIWEVRGPRRDFVHSKVMAWVAFDRGVKAVERFGHDGPVARWRATRDAIHAEVCEKGWNASVGAFTQSYGGTALDASLLMMPLVGFLPVHDPRVRSTVEQIERRLMVDGFVLRYHPDESAAVDGLPPGEGAFLPCTFWLVDNLALMGRRDDAERLFERLLSVRNDVGLLAEEYDPGSGRQVGNFPQAFTHVALVNSAFNLSRHQGPAKDRQTL
jgi:GH15 family glucan-1,4-alpha-glucosidase